MSEPFLLMEKKCSYSLKYKDYGKVSLHPMLPGVTMHRICVLHPAATTHSSPGAEPAALSSEICQETGERRPCDFTPKTVPSPPNGASTPTPGTDEEAMCLGKLP